MVQVPQNYTLSDLEEWDKKIQKLVLDHGLDCYPQEFLICDERDMLDFMTYSGMTSHYPHWSYGKAYELTKTLYHYGVEGLPYELVINSNPSLAYLMGDNTLALQVLTMAHVYGHNDFFKNNATFAKTRAADTLDRFKRHAEQVRVYAQRYGTLQVEQILDAAHALRWQCNRNVYVRQRPEVPVPLEQNGERRANWPAGGANRNPDENENSLPSEDILMYIYHWGHELADWERDLLLIVREESNYFLPQMQTKVMNEGWASYWHYTLLQELGLPTSLHLEFLVHHNQVVRPHPGGLNPYHLGFRIFKDIAERLGEQQLFEVRRVERDGSFIRRYLTEELVSDLFLFEYKPLGFPKAHHQVTAVGDEQGWKQVRDTLAASVGMGNIPTIHVVDGNHEGTGGLLLQHQHDGRDLDMAYAKETLKHVQTLWHRKVTLHTKINGRETELVHRP
ncbi:stage V sporulation protein R [Alicyclobacillaceae bacterium I2511]|nr:stage V sporulation protein R [Alicyclobacillaceae bacterium I2511]